MGKQERARGHAFERYVAKRLTEATGIKHSRILNQTRDGGADVRARSLPILHETKYQLNPDIWGALKQVEAACGATDLGIVWVKRRAKKGRPSEFIAALPGEDMLEILSMLVRSGEL